MNRPSLEWVKGGEISVGVDTDRTARKERNRFYRIQPGTQHRRSQRFHSWPGPSLQVGLTNSSNIRKFSLQHCTILKGTKLVPTLVDVLPKATT